MITLLFFLLLICSLQFDGISPVLHESNLRIKDNHSFQEDLIKTNDDDGVEKRYLMNFVNGNWSPWSSWSNCVTSFATYSRSRYRTCTNPAPKGGQFCYGSSKEVEACNKTCTCTGIGDPHYTTFDQQKIPFNGPCKYILAETRDPFEQCSFRVEAQHKMVGKAAYVDYVDVYVYGGRKIRMTHDKELYIDGYRNYPPYEEHGKYKVDVHGNGLRLETKCGLVVEIDKTWSVKINFPKRGAIYGICGDCNGKKDDYKTKNGHDVSNQSNKYDLIGNSYQANVQSCKPKNSTGSTCDPSKNPALLATIGTTSICNHLNAVNKKSIFLACIIVNIIEALTMFKMCVYDHCMLAQQPSQQHNGACHVINNFAASCYKLKLVSPTAVSAICPPKCQSNSFFNPSMTGCPNSCANPTASQNCSLPQVPGCACNPGFILDGSKCVLHSQCGCKSPNGNYYPVGTSIVVNNCRTKYVCSGTPPLFHKHNQTPCGQNAVCQLVNGSKQCICPPGLSGNPHTGCYRTTTSKKQISLKTKKTTALSTTTPTTKSMTAPTTSMATQISTTTSTIPPTTTSASTPTTTSATSPTTTSASTPTTASATSPTATSSTTTTSTATQMSTTTSTIPPTTTSASTPTTTSATSPTTTSASTPTTTSASTPTTTSTTPTTTSTIPTTTSTTPTTTSSTTPTTTSTIPTTTSTTTPTITSSTPTTTSATSPTTTSTTPTTTSTTTPTTTSSTPTTTSATSPTTTSTTPTTISTIPTTTSTTTPTTTSTTPTTTSTIPTTTSTTTPTTTSTTPTTTSTTPTTTSATTPTTTSTTTPTTTSTTTPTISKTKLTATSTTKQTKPTTTSASTPTTTTASTPTTTSVTSPTTTSVTSPTPTSSTTTTSTTTKNIPGPVNFTLPAASTKHIPGPVNFTLPAVSTKHIPGPVNFTLPAVSTKHIPGPVNFTLPAVSTKHIPGPVNFTLPAVSTKHIPGPVNFTLPAVSTKHIPGPVNFTLPAVSTKHIPGPVNFTHPVLVPVPTNPFGFPVPGSGKFTPGQLSGGGSMFGNFKPGSLGGGTGTSNTGFIPGLLGKRRLKITTKKNKAVAVHNNTKSKTNSNV